MLIQQVAKSSKKWWFKYIFPDDEDIYYYMTVPSAVECCTCLQAYIYLCKKQTSECDSDSCVCFVVFCCLQQQQKVSLCRQSCDEAGV